MSSSDVLVVGETPSLGRALADLLESDQLTCRYVEDLAREETELGETSVVVAACNATYSPTARKWIRGDLPRTHLVVVGSRDPSITPESGIHLVALPLPPKHFLRLVRGLVEVGPPMPDGTTRDAHAHDPRPSLRRSGGATNRSGPRRIPRRELVAPVDGADEW
jgi:hypothetical protein